MLQNCIRLNNDEPDSGSEAHVTTLDGGSEEGNIEIEEEIRSDNSSTDTA